jgi:hypothetical protein
LPLGEALNLAVEIHEIDQIFDLKRDTGAVILSLDGLSPDSAAELVSDVQSVTYKPLLFRSGDECAVSAALREYAGVAAVYASRRLSANEFGAHFI